jgi:uncharacterized protein YdeI (BOF family)
MKPIRTARAARSLVAVAAVVGLMAVSAAVLVLAGGCGSSESGDLYGEPLSGLEIAKVRDILARPGEYDGKAVALQGKIAQECPSGCWFNLQDDTGVIYVDINPSGFAIPQYAGKKVTVEGTVAVQGRRVMVVGKGVRVE